jgi:hypothetical protein
VSRRLRTDPRLVGIAPPVVEPSMATRRIAALIIVWRPEAASILTVAVFDG